MDKVDEEIHQYEKTNMSIEKWTKQMNKKKTKKGFISLILNGKLIQFSFAKLEIIL